MASTKIVIIGAGSLQFGLGTCGSIFNSKVLEGASVSLHDINAENLEYARNACQAKIDHDKLNFTLEATTDRKEALKGANFIISAIEVGPRFYWWNLDWKVPLKYGSTQVFGENGGPGGMFHAMRIVPPILDICEDINSICPDIIALNEYVDGEARDSLKKGLDKIGFRYVSVSEKSNRQDQVLIA